MPQRDPVADMAAAVAKVAAHETPPILARAPESGGEPRPEKSPLALACEQIAKLARLWFGLERRVSAIEAQPSARDGRDGRDGASVTGVRVNDKGHLIISISGAENDLGRVIGDPGPAGESIIGPKGDPGEPGLSIMGDPGADGRGVYAAEIDIDGQLIVIFSDGERLKLGCVVGPAGPPGTRGEPGTRIATGSGPPMAVDAHDGDLYIDVETGDLFKFKS